jgi:hypothetical protein
MSGYSIVELSGHIIDSLTLAKVIDKIQSVGCRYQINDLQIGEKKTDISYAQISLWTQSEEDLEVLLAELKNYGAYPIEPAEAELEACPADGQLPEGFFTRLNPPSELQVHGNWIPVERSAGDLVIVVDPERGTARLETVKNVKKGEQVLIGKAGLKVLPTLQGEQAHAQSIGR